MVLSPQVEKELKKPFGPVVTDLSEIPHKRIVSVGDICTLALLEQGIAVHLALFDFKTKRAELDSAQKKRLSDAFSHTLTYQNPSGTVSKKILDDAQTLLAQGGGVFIEGEEDLTALAFMRILDEDTVLVYGQPDQGVVVVESSKTLKKKVEGLLKRIEKS